MYALAAWTGPDGQPVLASAEDFGVYLIDMSIGLSGLLFELQGMRQFRYEVVKQFRKRGSGAERERFRERWLRAEREWFMALIEALHTLYSTHEQPGFYYAYDHLVRSAFNDFVRSGRLLFNPPDRMRLGDTERVEVRLTSALYLDAELLKNLRGHGEPQMEGIPTAPLMAVALKGDGFQITAYSDEEQRVTIDGITTWEFDIRALKLGIQRLMICVSLRIPVPGEPSEHMSVPVREVTIDVHVGAAVRVGHFVSANWQWFVATAIAIAAVVVAVLYH
ncbi:MAG: hypothetical protein ABSF03_35115 [Streptosporangiaceae bacterium]